MKGIASLAVVLALVATSAAAADQKPSAAHGKQLFLKVGCWQCHGTVGQGSTAGVRLAPDPLPVEALTTFVHETTGDMPKYTAKVLTDADLADIHAYLASIPQPASPDTIAILKNLKPTK